MATLYIVGRTEEVGRTDNPGRAVALCREHGLDPGSDIHSPEAWTKIQIERHVRHRPERNLGDVRAEHTGASGTVSGIAVARQEQQAAAIKATGIMGDGWAPTDPVFERGTRVMTLGMQNLTREGERLDAVGPLEHNLRAVAEKVAAEDRRAIDFDILDSRLHVNGDGLIKLVRPSTGKPGIPITVGLLDNLMGYFPEVFRKVAPAILADVNDGGFEAGDKVEVFNKYLVDRLVPFINGRLDDKRTAKYSRAKRGAKDGRVTLWVRKQEAGWQAFHVSSPGHTSKGLNVGQMAALIAESIRDGGYKGEASYNPGTSKLEFSGWTMPNHIVDLSAGDVFKGGFSGSSGDTNNGSYDLRASLMRNLCLNLIIVTQEDGVILNAPHITKPSRVRRALVEGLHKVDDLMQVIFPDLEVLSRDAGFDPNDTSEVESALVAVAKLGGLAMGRSHAEQNAIVEALLNGFAVEPNPTYSGALNALSRLHTEKQLDAYTVAQASGVAMEKLLIKARKGEALA